MDIRLDYFHLHNILIVIQVSWYSFIFYYHTMNKNILIPVVLLATTPFVVSCTKKPTDIPPPPAVTGETETVMPTVEETPVVPTSPTTSGAIETSSPQTVAPTSLTRTETVSYTSPSPDGMVEVEFSVTVSDGVIMAASATPKAGKQASDYNQSNFAKDVSASVVGKKAADLDVDAIGGASLTTAAFEMFVRSF